MLSQWNISTKAFEILKNLLKYSKKEEIISMIKYIVDGQSHQINKENVNQVQHLVLNYHCLTILTLLKKSHIILNFERSFKFAACFFLFLAKHWMFSNKSNTQSSFLFNVIFGQKLKKYDSTSFVLSYHVIMWLFPILTVQITAS